MKEVYILGAEVAVIDGMLNESDVRKIVETLHPMPCLLNLATKGSIPNWTVGQARFLIYFLAR